MTQWEYHVAEINTEYEIGEDGHIEDSPPGKQILESNLRIFGTEVTRFLLVQSRRSALSGGRQK